MANKNVRWCGVGTQFCKAPTCQLDYGPACDGNVRPKGADTKDVPRPKLGPVPYGKAIYTCNVNGDVALTFDDGPWEYTSHLLDMLAVSACNDYASKDQLVDPT